MLDLLDLKLQMVVRHLWVLEIKPGSPKKKKKKMIETAEPPLQPLNFLIAITWVIPIKI